MKTEGGKKREKKPERVSEEGTAGAVDERGDGEPGFEYFL